jgi:hypothetical protein
MTKLGDFLPIGLLLDAHYDFFGRDEVAQRNGDIFGYFLTRSFKTWFVEGILRFQKWFDVDVFVF